MATHSSILAWRISWTEELWATVHGVAKSQKQLKQLNTGTHTHTHTHTPQPEGCGPLRIHRGGWGSVPK